jgi:hypothetical protein
MGLPAKTDDARPSRSWQQLVIRAQSSGDRSKVYLRKQLVAQDPPNSFHFELIVDYRKLSDR